MLRMALNCDYLNGLLSFEGISPLTLPNKFSLDPLVPSRHERVTEFLDAIYEQR